MLVEKKLTLNWRLREKHLKLKDLGLAKLRHSTWSVILATVTRETEK